MNTSTLLSRCYASPSVVLPCTPVLLCSLSVNMNVGSGNHLVVALDNSDSDILDCWMQARGTFRGEGVVQQQTESRKSKVCCPHHSCHVLPQPQYSFLYVLPVCLICLVIISAEFGNHDLERHTAEYLKDFALFPKVTL